MLFATNDFTGTQANAVRKFITECGSDLKFVFDQGVPTETSNYTVLLNKPGGQSRCRHSSGLCAERYRISAQSSGQRHQVQVSVFDLPGARDRAFAQDRGAQGFARTIHLCAPPSEIAYPTNFGINRDAYKQAWHHKYADSRVEFGFNAIAGYTTGLVLETTLAAAESLDQLALRQAVFKLSGELKTLDGAFQLDANGAQIGEITPIGQLVLDNGQLKFVTVYPLEVATGKPIYPRP